MRKINKVMFTKYEAEFVSKALEQPKAGPRISGPLVLVHTYLNWDWWSFVYQRCIQRMHGSNYFKVISNRET